MPFKKAFDEPGHDQQRAPTEHRLLLSDPARTRSNLTIETNAYAQTLMDGIACVGVRWARTNARHWRQKKSVCGGSINSPQLLELSGIGQSDRLNQLGINVVHDLPGLVKTCVIIIPGG